MDILSKDINLMIANIEEYISDQDVHKMEYVLSRYKSFIKRAGMLKIDCSSIENNIPNSPKDAYEIILSELQMLGNKIQSGMKNRTSIQISNNEKMLVDYIKENGGIESAFGKIYITVSEKIGQGGNGTVYIGRINNTEIAIKFLIGYNSNKYTRFKAEYFNVNLVKDKMINTVNNIHYGELKIDNAIFPYIIMKKYRGSLKDYHKRLEKAEWHDVKKIFEFLTETLHYVHKENIVHRDIKPDNILIDENYSYVLADFGIAHFEKEDFPINNKTKDNDRLANFEFSAPEQVNSRIKCTAATDIYCMAQVVYWFVFGQVHRGTGIKYFEEMFEEKEAIVLSRIIHKCLQNRCEDRYQSIEEIKNDYNTLCRSLNNKKEFDPFEDMYTFHDILSSTNPDFYNGVSFIEDVEEMKAFFHKLNTANFKREIEFNTGSGNNTVKKVTYLNNGNFSIDGREITVERIWGSVSADIYNDICILELKPSSPYMLDGKEHFGVAIINDEIIVPIDKIESGYIKIDGRVCKTSELKVEERYINNEYKYIVLGTFHQCSIIEKNDLYIEKLKEKSTLNREIIIELKKNISKNKTHDVSMRL
ncbi:hypothetical protein FDF69_06355 [Clostridium sporogenes]|uniref:protein kinase domain-containing protein n=1 Tax=Clostridium sporogenes TaxID=1509 RepID=UPI0013D61CDE|nr:protein kinase [Clostridium sporogenes]NFF65905.1 hypothetical protein [Clostridium sporogenes]NFF98294.1 hypothetical protein [Clostridium sporogenes]NFG05372.1 hypothetical protein [Clostridium sporogenes]NFG50957.1 hypothetical protein [Clostridium sporogenes]NFP83211.1 hypothetical protein [Clostridium sporogenes]